MKKIVSVFLAFIFGLSAMGMEVTMHHCKGETSYIVFGIDFNKHCKCKHENRKHNKNCCDRKSIFVKTVGDSFSNTTKVVSFNKICLNPFLVSEGFLTKFCSYKNYNSASYISKVPPDRGIPLNTLNCVSRI